MNKNQIEIQEFFYRNYSSFVHFAESFVLERAIAEDIVQDVFVDYIEHRNQLVVQKTLKAYFIRSLRNKCLNYLRDKKIHDKHEVLYLEALLNTEDAEVFSDPVITEAVNRAIDELPGEMGKIFKLRFFQGKNYAEVAETLDISKNTVKTQLTRGKKKLKDSLIEFSRFNIFSIFC